MAVALRSPESVSALIPVDNAPVNAALKSDFPKYVQGMQKIEAAKVSKQSDANKILEDYEEVRPILLANSLPKGDEPGLLPVILEILKPSSPSLSVNSFLPT